MRSSAVTCEAGAVKCEDHRGALSIKWFQIAPQGRVFNRFAHFLVLITLISRALNHCRNCKARSGQQKNVEPQKKNVRLILKCLQKWDVVVNSSELLCWIENLDSPDGSPPGHSAVSKSGFRQEGSAAISQKKRYFFSERHNGAPVGRFDTGNALQYHVRPRRNIKKFWNRPSHRLWRSIWRIFWKNRRFAS